MRISKEDKELIKHVLDSWLAKDVDYAVCKAHYNKLWTRPEQPNRIPDDYFCKSKLTRFVWDIWHDAKLRYYSTPNNMQKFYDIHKNYIDKQIDTIITKHLLEKLSWLQETQ